MTDQQRLEAIGDVEVTYAALVSAVRALRGDRHLEDRLLHMGREVRALRQTFLSFLDHKRELAMRAQRETE
jgi:hypothetical protein